MSDPAPRDARLRRLKMRSMRRGIKEMDLILMAYCDARAEALNAAQLASYEALLDENDQDLYQWVSGQVAVPDTHAAIIADIRQVALAKNGGVGRNG